eukprot:gene6679-20579_t
MPRGFPSPDGEEAAGAGRFFAALPPLPLSPFVGFGASNARDTAYRIEGTCAG